MKFGRWVLVAGFAFDCVLALVLVALLLRPDEPSARGDRLAGGKRLVVTAPRVLALGVRVPLTVGGALPGERLRIEARPGLGSSWRTVWSGRARGGPRFKLRVGLERPWRRFALRVVGVGIDGRRSTPRLIQARPITLAAVGDVNLQDAELTAGGDQGFVWQSVGRSLRSADIAFGNLECSVSRRGQLFPKQFNFRAAPETLSAARQFAGFDVLNLANNHVGDYGPDALLDTVRAVARRDIKPVGAGSNIAAAARPRVVERRGLRVAFVGFSEILPLEFAATPGRPGTQWATDAAVIRGVRAARRVADVVIATFHWGIERMAQPTERQRELAQLALDNGAGAVIGAHPHVLQPIERQGRKLVAYSLGNFVFAAAGETARTGILELKLSTRGVEDARLTPITISGARPVSVDPT